MASAVVRTPKLTDGRLYQLAQQLLELFPDGEAKFTYPLMETGSADAETDFEGLIGSKQRLIQEFHFSFPGTVKERVSFHRGVVEEEHWRQHPNQSGFARAVPSAHFDEIGLLAPERGYGGQNQPAPDRLSRNDIFQITDLINELAVDSAFVGQRESATTLSDIVAGQIGDSRQLHLEMTRDLAKARAEADKQNEGRRAALEAEAAEKISFLAKREAELETRRSELNDREPQHERRRLREHLTSRLQEEISRPNKQARNGENRSYFLYLAAGSLFVMLSVGLTLAANLDDVTGSYSFWAYTVKSLAAGVAGAAFIWAGLAGLKTAAIANRKHEDAIQRYGFDMDRASWIVETILQMNSVEKADVPTEWLESVCRDLFVFQDKPSDENRSLEAFAALFDATARAKIGTNGLEFEVDRKGARRLAQA
ncbi:hypothetical protein FPZ54_12250 [Sphingomonas suaedae]|uniref:Uncharacterized protein n=1 Tax=Sphingomonas suaedae TaxID=2599297 RepID=A0A518RGX9_9SPHN|nr:hypothetical protein [Sphingomonas suaedae]QDX26705.1 hypothetical protein FPZ54_12250 [Sphingomonas suaedae]